MIIDSKELVLNVIFTEGRRAKLAPSLIFLAYTLAKARPDMKVENIKIVRNSSDIGLGASKALIEDMEVMIETDMRYILREVYP